MKCSILLTSTILFTLPAVATPATSATNNTTRSAEFNQPLPENSSAQSLQIASRISGLKLGLHRYSSAHKTPLGTVLLVHGSSFPAKLSFAFQLAGRSWVEQLTSAGFEVYTLDFLGYGDSDRYPAMVEKHQTALPLGRGAEVAVDLNLAVDYILAKTRQTKINLIAHSWGGAVAARFAGDYPEKVHSLVLYAAITPVTPAVVPPSEQVPAYVAMTPQERLQSLNALAPQLHRPLLAPELFNNWGDEWLASDPYSKDQTVTFPAGPQADVNDFLSGQSFYNPAKITAQVLIVRGEYDTYPSHQHAQQLFAALTQAKHKQYVEIEQGTHVLHLEKNRHALYRVVNDFLRQAGQ